MQKTILILGLLLICLEASAQTADFNADRTSGCAGLLTVNFTNTSSGTVTNYLWTFGDGGTSSLQSPSHTYTSAGTYTVTLTVSGPSGSDTETRSNFITVHAIPQASFAVTPDTICEGSVVTLTSTSLQGSGAITQCLWTFNDGTPADTACPSINHVYLNGSNTLRTYFPNLLIVDEFGCNSVANGSVVVAPRPSASFSFSVTVPCTAPSTVAFTNNSTVTNLFSWDFGIQSTSNDTSTSRSPIFTYDNPGTYTVTLTAGPAGCSSSATQNLQLENPQASFVASDTTICINTSVQFISAGTSGILDWNFGDPSSSSNSANGDSVSHLFQNPGVYTVTMNLSAGGCSDQATVRIHVRPLPAILFVADDRTSCSFPFTVNFYDSTRAAVSWSWNFGDPGSGATNTSNLENPTHTFNGYGNFSVTLSVTDTNGCINSATYTDFIIVAPVTVDFLLEDSGCVGKTFPFSAQVNSPGDPVISNYEWDFGDGTGPFSVTTAFTDHTYNDTGIFDVTLTVTTATGCTATFSRPGFIRVGIKPTADFAATPNTICFNDTVSFIDLSPTPPNITSWSWDFGDGNGSQAQNPVHVFNSDTSGTADPFDVTLIVFNNGCPDTLIRSDFISVLGPKPNFVPIYNCNNPLSVLFSNYSDSLGMTYQWDFGDGDTSSLRDPVHVFPSRGDYDVTLLDSNLNTGCAASITIGVQIRNLDPNVTYAPDSGCAPLTVQFTGSGSQDFNSLQWDFGDPASAQLNNSNFADTLHTYNQPGSYYASLTAVDIHGCAKSESVYITANGPKAGFLVSQETGCAPLSVQFIDTSRTFGSSIVTWSWDFGNGQSASGTYPTYTATYDDPGNFAPTLIVTDANGCTSQQTANYYIRPTRPEPLIQLSPNDTNACLNEPITFLAYPGPIVAQPVAYQWSFGDGTTSSANALIHSYSANGTYQVSLIATDNNGCTDTTNRQVLVYTTPAHVTITPYDSCVELNGIRQAQLFVNMVSDSNLYAANYQWDLELTSISQNLSSVFYTYSVPPDTYYVSMILTNQFGCRDTFFDPAAVIIPGPQGSFSFSPDSGCRPLTVTFAGSGSNIDLYTWDFGDGNVIAGTTDETVVHTYVSDAVFVPRFYVGFELSNGSTCYVPTDTAGHVEVTTLIGVDVLPETLYVDEGSSGHVAVQVFDNYNLGPYNYQWSPPGLVSPSTQWPDSFTVSTGDYSGYVTCTVPYGNGCTSSDSALVLFIPCENEIVIPNVFTPNGDGKNDDFHIDDLCELPGFNIVIYNRWGRIVFESDDVLFRWNGTDEKGNAVSDGTYYYLMDTSKQKRQGWIEVIRDE